MPDDSPPEFKDAQRKHGDQIRFERDLMRITGLTRDQVRSSLTGFNRVTNFNGTPPITNQPAPPAPTIQETHLESKSLGVLGREGGLTTGTSQGSGMALPRVTLTLCQNGILVTYSLSGVQV